MRRLILWHYFSDCLDKNLDVDVWHASDDSVRSIQNDHHPPWFLPKICYVSEELYLEAMPLYISMVRLIIRNDFVYHSAWLLQVLDKFTIVNNKIGFDSVRHLSFLVSRSRPCFGNAGPAMELISLCQGLRYLEFPNDVKDMMKVDNSSDSQRWVPKSVAEVVGFHGLETLFNCRKLEKLHIKFCTRWWWLEQEIGFERKHAEETRWYAVRVAEPVFYNAIAWIGEKFRKRFGQEAEVTAESVIIQ
jgi:hypothetical protein